MIIFDPFSLAVFAVFFALLYALKRWMKRRDFEYEEEENIMQSEERATKFLGSARSLTAEIANTDGWHLNAIEQLVAEHLYDFACHILMHTTPAAGSTIRKFQGLDYEGIVKQLPDMES